MNLMSKKTAVSWTGGKDSSLALYEAKILGYDVRSLVTFVPSKSEFLAHPLSFMKYQAEALDLPHYILAVSEPFKESYEKAINSLKSKHGITTLVTGDIAEVNCCPNYCYPNWIKECSKYSGVSVLTPLWGVDRHELIDRIFSYKFKAIFSCVKKPWFTDDWLGIEFNKNSLEKLCMLNTETGLDICGEQGEYHSLVVDGPPFKKSIHISSYSKHASDSLMYIRIQKVALKEK